MDRVKRDEVFKYIEENNVTLGEAVKITRKLTGANQKKWGDRMNIPVSRLSAIERDKANVTLATAAKLLDVWGLELVVKPKSSK